MTPLITPHEPPSKPGFHGIGALGISVSALERVRVQEIGEFSLDHKLSGS